VTRRRNPARLVIALSVAATLAVFLLYTSIAGGGTPSVLPSEVAAHDGQVSLAGRVVGPVRRDGRTIRFTLRDPKGTATVPVTYAGSVPDMFQVGRDVYLDGELQRGTFVGESGTLVTRCPSKYTKRSSA
jgi:cytochrome c-type biogenesis protein CcmE